MKPLGLLVTADKPRRTIAHLMLAVAVVALALGLLRSRLGVVFALGAGGVVGCGLAPMFACRGMRRLDRELAGRVEGLPRSHPRVLGRPTLLAQSYVLIWAAWFLAGVIVAAAGIVLSRLLRPGG
jgi:hypothetical protein